MKKLFPFLLLVFFTACEQEIPEPLEPLSDQETKIGKGQKKVTICHINGKGEFSVLEIAEPALAAHLKHGDYLPDADGDGYTAIGACTGSADDCDDTNPDVNPGATEIINNSLDDDCNPETPDCPSDAVLTGLRLGGQPGDSFVGPTCNNDNTYRTCFYVSGTNLPTETANYGIKINGISYPIAFTAMDGPDVVICATGLPAGETAVDVEITLAECAVITEEDLYDAPESCCEITDIRLGGQPGDAYIGPTCDADGTYRTCFYVTGTNLPSNISAYSIELDNVSYTPAFLQPLSSNEVVICTIGLPTGTSAVDLTIALTGCGSLTKAALFVPPKTCLSDCSASTTITNIRLGGQPGDAYIGPTCNADNTYRTCFYVSGSDLSGNVNDYRITINGVVYPTAFFQQLSNNEVVLCATNLPTGQTNVDVQIEILECTSLEATDLYNAPTTCP